MEKKREEQVPMTIRGKRLLEEELERLIKTDREQIKNDISEARNLGDLKENAEYQSAKEKQSLIEGRILELQHKISRSKIVDVSKLSGTKIIFGATVTLYDTQKEKSFTYQIVGVDEADLKDCKISYVSPLARALIGKQEGDVVNVVVPKGTVEYEIEEVEYK